MAAALQAAFPNAPVLDSDGGITPAWRAFLLALMTRTGGSPGVSATETARALVVETTARTTADTALGAAVSAETAAREAADSAEATARTAADATLSGEIAALGNASPVMLSRLWWAAA